MFKMVAWQNKRMDLTRWPVTQFALEDLGKLRARPLAGHAIVLPALRARLHGHIRERHPWRWLFLHYQEYAAPDLSKLHFPIPKANESN